MPANQRQDRWDGENGQALVETAIAFPLLLLIALVLVQFALFYQAESVVTGAVQDGARVAAAEGGSVGDGVTHAEAVLRAGLGRSAAGVTVQGSDGGTVVMVQARGQLRLILPWPGGGSLPLEARSIMSKERFRAAPNG